MTGEGGGYGTRMSVKSNDGGRGGYGTRMSVKSNDGGGGAQFSEASCYVTNVIVVLCFFGIVWRKVHFLNTCFSHVQCRVYIPGFIQWEAWLGSPLEFWELNRNEHLGSIYF